MNNNRCRFILLFINPRESNEVFALTPYLTFTQLTLGKIKIRGIGIRWVHYLVTLALGWNLPSKYPTFSVLS